MSREKDREKCLAKLKRFSIEIYSCSQDMEC